MKLKAVYLRDETKDYGRLDVVYDYDRVTDAFSLRKATDEILAREY